MESLSGLGLSVALALLGIWTMVVRRNLVWKLLGLNVASGGGILFLVALSHRPGVRPPIVGLGPGPAADALPQALVLTAVVIHFATLALALALVILLTEYRHTQDARKLEEGSV
ncbi:MAG: cation:proton antiporter subunit C [Candidatus Bipolaricaulota bacterium]|nr:cation:proton antiporter subunit C [Candidatus Bipolaricaulota bacterium]MDW8126559.1 cation:proton antiporter subunit C [Candidatus Bipolaricaulota bacterium]